MQLQTLLRDTALAQKTAMVAALALAGLGAGAATYAMWSPGEADNAEVAVVEEGAPAFTPVVLAPAQPTSASADELLDRGSVLGDPVRLTRALQKELARIGCYDGPVSGRWTSRTQQAMARLIEQSNARLPAHAPDPVLLALAESKPEGSCDGSVTIATRSEMPPVQASSDGPPGAPSAQTIVSPAPEPVLVERSAQREVAPAPAFETASIDTAPETTSSDALAAAAPAAVAAAAVPYPAPHRKTATRKRKKQQPSLARTFKSIQRSLNKLF